MGALTKRTASVVLAVVLSGTPALLAACAMLCVPAMSHAAHGAVPQDAPPRSACCVTERETPPAHAHHGTPDESTESPVAPDVATQLTSTDASCCPDGQSGAVAAAAVTRIDSGLLIAPPIVTTAAVTAPPSLSVAGVGPPHRPLRSPFRPPLVLRI